MIVDTPPAIVQIAQRAQRQEQGVFLYHMRKLFDVHAGGRRRHEELELEVVSDATRTIKVRVLRSLVDGKASDAAALQKIEDQYEHPNPADVVHRPFDPAYLGEYTYQQLDAKTFKFTSAVRDSAHGDGTFSLDDDGDIVSYAFQPAVLPKYTTAGTVTAQRSEVLPGIWQLTRETDEYKGRFAFLSGGATVSITYDSYAQYPDAASAIAALKAYA